MKVLCALMVLAAGSFLAVGCEEEKKPAPKTTPPATTTPPSTTPPPPPPGQPAPAPG
jgi:hypothetical protein